MASNELSSSMSRKSFYEHEETVKSNQMASKKLSNSSDGKEQIEDMDEKELKHLLDEAITFRNPRDANEKSETFKRLLQNVTDEDERARNTGLNPFFKAQSNSLQNLIDDSNFNQSSHQSHTSSKKHQQRRKNSTSVSTRRLEGGSLPVDMHHSSAIQSPPDQPFLSELKNNKKRQKEKQAKETVIDIPDNETEDRKYQRNEKEKDSYLEHGIEMKTFSTHHLLDDHNISKYTNACSAANTITTMASLTSSPISTSMITTKSSTTSSMTSVDSSLRLPLNCSGGEKYHTKDKLISYQQAQSAEIITCPGSTINHSNHILLAGGPGPNYGSTSSGGKIEPTIPLPAGAGISSVMDSKSSFAYNSSSNKRQPSREDMHASALQTTPQLSLNPQASTNAVSGGGIVNASGSSKDPKAKKRAAKSERNEKTIDVQSIEGFCGHETVEALLSYIDGNKGGNSGNQKNHPKNGLLSTQLLNSDEKKKKMVAKNKEKVNKLKKSNSMDELCSTGRQQQVKEDEKVTANKIAQDSSTVTLRSKSSITKKSIESKENKQQSKRNERRSWGTEGLSSWPDSTPTAAVSTATTTNSILTNNDEENLQNEQETSSSSSSSGVQLDIHESNNNNITTIISSVSSQMEMSSTISAEAEKFQLVSKKRKVKRKSSEAPEFKTSTQTTLSTTTPVVNNNLYNSTMSRGGRGNPNEGSQQARTDFRGTKHENAPRNKKPMSQQDAKQTQNNSTQQQQPSQQQQQSAKSRRKSTSSMPHSEEGEYSDGGDSVQSLPIETTKTTSSLLSAPQQNAAASNPPLPNPPTHITSAEIKTSSKKNPIEHKQLQLAPQQQVVQQTLQKPTTISYADIAKTSSIRQNNNLGTTNAASTEKWPSISSSSSSHQQQQQNQQNIQQNLTNVTSDPFAPSNFDASNNNISNNQQGVKQPKVTSASISTSTMSFPDLVESNNNRNKQLSSNNDVHQIAPVTVSVATSTALNGDALQTELNGGSVGGMVFMCDTTSIDPDRINNNKISYSQSLLESNNDLDANGNAQKTTESSKNVLTKSKSVDHNNLSSIEHYPALEKTKQTLSEVLSKPIESLTKGKQKQITKSIATTVAPLTIVDDGKGKKKAQKKNVSTSTTPPTQSQNQNFTPNSQHSNHNHQQRPAVIIMNDNASFENTNELGITFGFDIDEHLLCGQNGDAIMVGEECSSNNNNNNCDIMNTNLSSNNLSNNQSCGIEFEDFYVPVVTTTAIIHTSSPEQSNNNNEMSADLGYISTASMLLPNTTQSPQITFCDNGPNERDFALQVTPMEIQQTIKYEHVFVPASLPQFISPQIAPKSYNYDEIVAFVSEEWTKAQRNGIFFNGQ